MTPADRTAWLLRVEGMTRSERLMALAVAHAGLFHAGDNDAGEQWKQCALDLIAALERSASARADALLHAALAVIDGLASQQAVPDDSWKATYENIAAYLREREGLRAVSSVRHSCNT